MPIPMDDDRPRQCRLNDTVRAAVEYHKHTEAYGDERVSAWSANLAESVAACRRRFHHNDAGQLVRIDGAVGFATRVARRVRDGNARLDNEGLCESLVITSQGRCSEKLATRGMK